MSVKWTAKDGSTIEALSLDEIRAETRAKVLREVENRMHAALEGFAEHMMALYRAIDYAADHGGEWPAALLAASKKGKP